MCISVNSEHRARTSKICEQDEARWLLKCAVQEFQSIGLQPFIHAGSAWIFISLMSEHH
jgi:hypothetical protein